MIIDRIKNIQNYSQLIDVEPFITAFLKRMEQETLPDGKYELQGDKLFAIVQRYKTHEKSEALMESHRKYADLQYICHGEEMIFYDVQEELEMDGAYKADIIFYKRKPDRGGILLSEGMFGYFAPQDAHMPCITGTNQSFVTKIVFKILL